jgi:hypothetical protein
MNVKSPRSPKRGTRQEKQGWQQFCSLSRSQKKQKAARQKANQVSRGYQGC